MTLSSTTADTPTLEVLTWVLISGLHGGDSAMGCAADEGRTMQHDSYKLTTLTCEGLRPVIKHYKINDLGHCWFSYVGDYSVRLRDCCGDHLLNCTLRVLDLFSTWDLTNSFGAGILVHFSGNVGPGTFRLYMVAGAKSEYALYFAPRNARLMVSLTTRSIVSRDGQGQAVC